MRRNEALKTILRREVPENYMGAVDAGMIDTNADGRLVVFVEIALNPSLNETGLTYGESPQKANLDGGCDHRFGRLTSAGWFLECHTDPDTTVTDGRLRPDYPSAYRVAAWAQLRPENPERFSSSMTSWT